MVDVVGGVYADLKASGARVTDGGRATHLQLKAGNTAAAVEAGEARGAGAAACTAIHAVAGEVGTGAADAAVTRGARALGARPGAHEHARPVGAHLVGAANGAAGSAVRTVSLRRYADRYAAVAPATETLGACATHDAGTGLADLPSGARRPAGAAVERVGGRIDAATAAAQERRRARSTVEAEVCDPRFGDGPAHHTAAAAIASHEHDKSEDGRKAEQGWGHGS